MKSILGISAFYHDSAATILIDGKIIAAAQEERFTRIKHSAGFPYNAIKFCLNFCKVKLSDVNHIAINRNPKQKIISKLISSSRGLYKFESEGYVKQKIVCKANFTLVLADSVYIRPR